MISLLCQHEAEPGEPAGQDQHSVSDTVPARHEVRANHERDGAEDQEWEARSR